MEYRVSSKLAINRLTGEQYTQQAKDEVSIEIDQHRIFKLWRNNMWTIYGEKSVAAGSR